MNHQLSQKLKDAGFPQKSERNKHCGQDACSAGNRLCAYDPTLSELIKACGDGFVTLNRANNNQNRKPVWQALINIEGRIERAPTGTSAEEAVANLWLVLSKKNRPKDDMEKAVDVLAESPSAIVGDEPIGMPLPIEEKYLAKMKIGGREYFSEGATLDEAILNLNPYIRRGVAVLTISHGEKSITKVVNGPTIYKLFGKVSDLMKRIGLKNVKTIFGF